MDLFKKAFKDLTPVLNSISQQGKQAMEDISKKIKDINILEEKTFDQQIIEIIPQIYWMPFPQPQIIGEAANYLNSKYGMNYYIWNVSEHKYNIEVFNNQVAEHCSGGFPNPGLEEILVISKSILLWINSEKQNVAFVHCQNTRGRSALILSCVLCLSQNFSHPGQALTYFCQKTNTQDSQILFSSQKLYLNYFANILTGVKLNNSQVKIKRVIFSEVPRVIRIDEKNKQEEAFRPYLQLFKGNKILYNSLNNDQVLSYYPTDMTIWFDLGGVQVSDDLLFRCKHFHSNSLRYPAFRMMLHSGFAHDNIIRLIQKDIDFTNNVNVSDNFFIDIIFEQKQGGDTSSEQELKSNIVQQNQNNQNEFVDMNYIVNECSRQIEEEQEGAPAQTVVDEKSKQIERIINNNQLENQIQITDTSKFSISDEISGEKQNRSSASSNQSSQIPQQNQLVNKLLTDLQVHQDNDLDDEIDDYLQNLQKN